MPSTRYRKPTIKDVAAQAGVSITTVSNFVSGRVNVCSPDTAQRIRAAISALHYTPSSLSRGLGRTATRTIGVCMQNPSDRGENPFADRMWRGLNEEADDRDYALLHYPTSVRESDSHLLFLDGRIEGLVMSAAHADPRPARLAAAGMPTVLLTRSRNIPAGCGAVYADEAQGVDLALTHLWSLGHRRIAHLAGPTPTAPQTDADRETLQAFSDYALSSYEWSDIALWRVEAFTAWMEEHGIFGAPVSGPHSWEAVAVENTVETWFRLPQRPTAFLCANDNIALAALTAARRLGWHVPEELSIVGVDDNLSAAAADPPLTTVKIDAARLGHEALHSLLRLMDGASSEECRRVLPASALLIRSSTAPVCEQNS